MSRFLNRFSNYKVRSKLILLNGIFLITLVILGSVVNLLFKSSQTINILTNQHRVFIEYFERGIVHFSNYELSEDESQLNQAITHLNKANAIAFTFAKIDSILTAMPKKDWLPYLYHIYKEGVGFDISRIELMGDQIKIIVRINPKILNEIQQVANDASILLSGVIQSVDPIAGIKTDGQLTDIQNKFEKIHTLSNSFSKILLSLNEYLSNLIYLLIIVAVIVLGAIVTFISYRISLSISDPISKLVDNFKQIARGNLKSTVNIDSKNEIGDLSNAFLKIQVGLQDIILYSKKVAKGDYSSKLEPKSEDDELTVSLNRMAEKLEEVKIKTEREAWVQKGINGLDDQMRGNSTVRDLSKKIIAYLSNFLKFEIGAVYVYDEVLEHLELTGSIGLNTNEIHKIVQIGEGLIGAAALQGSLQILNTKNKYHKVFSASGEIIPEKLYLLPLHIDNHIQAVIEFAPVNELSEWKLEFLKLITERISVNLNAAVARYRNKELLDKTLEQSEILQAREEELRKKFDENKLIQEKLVQEKALLDSMLRTIPDYVYFKDLDSKFLRISESMVKLFETDSADKIIGKSDFDFHTKSNAQLFFDEEQKIISNKEGLINDIREGIDENKNKLCTSVTKLPMYDETGKCIGTFGISKNVTKIKQLEVEVKEQNDKLLTNQNELENTIGMLQRIQSELEREKTLMDSLLNNLPDAVYFKDLESKFVKVSNSLPKLFGFEKPEEVYGKSDFDFFTNEHASKAFNDEQQIINTKKPIIGYVEKETHNDGSIRYVSTTKMPYLDEHGTVVGTFGISRDITKIKELELEIKKRNEKLQEKQDELTKAYNELNRRQEELQTANEELKAQEEELRVANEELAEQTNILTKSEKSLQVQQEELRVTNEELELKTNELELQKKDITEKNSSLVKALNELKQKAKELELASQYKSEFLANMSHELRTPLNSLLILSKLLGNNKDGNLTDDQVKSANIIYKSGKDLLDLINEILDLSKIEAGKMNFEFNNIAAEEIKTEIIQSFKPVAENKGLTFELIQSGQFPKTIYTDKQRLLQVIKNILSNAFKFTNTGGIKINFGIPQTNTLFTNQHLNSNNTYFISVEDTGVGIPQNKFGAIFQAFQQADGSISRKFGGTGLGLSISKELIRVLGGEIHVASSENIGSTFTLLLPLNKNLVGIESNKNGEENSVEIALNEPDFQAKKESEDVINDFNNNEIPVFIDDDREAPGNRTMVLIIHQDKEKAKELLFRCRERNFNSVVAENISNGIKLAEKYSPKAIIISEELYSPIEYEKLKDNAHTRQIPIHHVSRIEDSTFNDLEELKTPSSHKIQPSLNDIESKLSNEFNQVLIVEDDPETQQTLHLLFKNKDIIIHEAKTGKQAYEMISTKKFDCVILDLGLPDFSGKELLEKLNSNKIPIPYIIIHTAKELSKTEIRELNKYSESIVIKGIKSDDRLMDEVSLFLHQIENKHPKNLSSLTHDFSVTPGFKGKKILLVDDDIRNIFALAQVLEEKEIEVLEAENGEVAIDILKNNNDIDLILMDIMMPVMDGYEAMKIIREIPELQNIPIITLTAKAMKEDYQKAIDSGANDYISKPLDVDKLFELLKIWLFK